MTGPESFFQRWSRRKRAAGAAPAADAAVAPDPPSTAAPAAAGAEAALPEVDLAALPPLESITATTDITGYLAPGVPAELTRAALRRAWVADPAIRDFVGIAENQWDFTAPEALPGFGALAEDEVRRLVDEVFGAPQPAAAAPGIPAAAAEDAGPVTVSEYQEAAGEAAPAPRGAGPDADAPASAGPQSAAPIPKVIANKN
jgi:hypothetical protein